jgi:RNA polymerase sigma-70 factor (ECF subfamily)
MPEGQPSFPQPTALDFSRLFESEFGYAWNSLRRLGVRPADVEDQVHELFLRAHKHFEKLDLARPVRPWLYAFAVRVASEYRRAPRNRRETPGPMDELRDSSPNVEEQVARAEVQAQVLMALESLDLDRAAVLVGVDIDGHSGPDMAHALGIPLNTVYSRLRLARADFKLAFGRASRGKERP